MGRLNTGVEDSIRLVAMPGNQSCAGIFYQYAKKARKCDNIMYNSLKFNKKILSVNSKL